MNKEELLKLCNLCSKGDINQIKEKYNDIKYIKINYFGKDSGFESYEEAVELLQSTVAAIPHNNFELFSFILNKIDYDTKYEILTHLNLSIIKNDKFVSLICLYLASYKHNFVDLTIKYINKHLPNLSSRNTDLAKNLLNVINDVN
jgi:hypothetical protein